MRITGVRSVLYEYELRHPIGDANMPSGARRRVDLAVFVSTDEGVEGVSIGRAMGHASIQAVASTVIGEDPRSVRGLFDRMVESVWKPGNQGSISAAIAAIDNALWDLRAKWNGVPLWRELGATIGRVKAYASGLDMALSDSELREYYTRMAGQGITAGKLKVGLDLDADLRRLAIMEEALGGRPRRPTLLIDVNEYWSPKQAIRRVAEMEREFDIAWVEEPVGRSDYRGLRQVSRGIRSAVATGENLTSLSEFVPLLIHEAVDVIQINANNTTGITAALRVADMSHAFERPVALMNCAGRFTAHLAAALPNHLMMEVLDLGRDAVFTYDSVIKDGWIVLGDMPGNGLTFDPEKLERLRVDGPDPTGAPTPSSNRGGQARRGYLAGLREGPADVGGSAS